MKINKYIQQLLLLTPLKIVQSTSWATLAAVLAFPSFLINRNYSGFFLKKAVAVWSKNEAASTTKIAQIAFSDGKSLEEILNQWVEEQKEEKGETIDWDLHRIKNAVLKFSSNHSYWEAMWHLVRPINGVLDLHYSNSMKHRATSLPDIFHLEPFRSQLTSLNLKGNQLIALPESFGNLQALTSLNLSLSLSLR